MPRWYATADLDRRLTPVESSALYAALEAQPQVADPGPVGNGIRYGGFLHFDVEAESAETAARKAEIIMQAVLAQAAVDSKFAIHELIDPAGKTLTLGDFDSWIREHDTAYRQDRSP